MEQGRGKWINQPSNISIQADGDDEVFLSYFSFEQLKSAYPSKPAVNVVKDATVDAATRHVPPATEATVHPGASTVVATSSPHGGEGEGTHYANQGEHHLLEKKHHYYVLCN